MAQDNGDILEDISDDDLPKLAEMYEEHKEWAPYAHSAITSVIKLKKKGKNTELYVMSPNSCWREDGTFFLYLQHNRYYLCVFSLDKTGKNIYKGLMETKRLDELCLFYVIHEIFYSTIRQYAEDKKLRAEDTYSYMFSISRHDALKYTIECPPEVYIKKLDKSHVPTIWPHRLPTSENYLNMLLEMNDGYGLFLKSNNQLVAWMVMSMLGQLGSLETKEEHRRKGYGSIITKYASKELAKMGYNPFSTVLVENDASIGLFTKLGFKRLGGATYIDIEHDI